MFYPPPIKYSVPSLKDLNIWTWTEKPKTPSSRDKIAYSKAIQAVKEAIKRITNESVLEDLNIALQLLEEAKTREGIK